MARKGRHGPTMVRTGTRARGVPETNPALGAAIMEVVDTQLRDGTPPETRHTFDRLLADGHTEDEARRLIACAMTSEIFDVLTHKQPYDEALEIGPSAAMRCSLTKVMRASSADTRTRRGRAHAGADVVPDGIVAARVTSAHPATISPATSTWGENSHFHSAGVPRRGMKGWGENSRFSWAVVSRHET